MFDWIRKAKQKTLRPFQGNINSGNPTEIGIEFLDHFTKLGGLEASHSVLDVGSGYGRMAIPLTDFLLPTSKYHGIEIIKKGSDWCSKNITPLHKNFKFKHIDVKNARYNPEGKKYASEFTFPFEDNSFDFVFLTSVFTHMLPKDLENYLSEISRVTKQDGRIFITYFLLNNESIELLNSKKGSYSMKFDYENCKIESLEDPEFAIAYPEHEIRELYETFDLNLQATHYGNWCGRIDHTSHQDIVIATRI